jgi:Amt family ammonium transporter
MSCANPFHVAKLTDKTSRQNLILECIANSLDETNMSVDTFFLIWSASLVFFMQTGFAMLCAGYVRIKNLQNTMLKNILDTCGAALGFYTVGYAFAFGGDGDSVGKTTFVGNTNFFSIGVEDKAVWLFQYSFAATSATVVAGTLAERCQMLAYLLYSTTITAFVYPVVSHSIWNDAGFLSSYNADPFLASGVIDFSGCLVVHLTGGITALIAAKILGPRKGRFDVVDGKKIAHDFPGHSDAYKVSTLMNRSSYPLQFFPFSPI